MTITLEDCRRFYVNRANEKEYFDWERLLHEVRPGDTIHLTAVQPWASREVEPGQGITPLAGVRTDSVIYMDERIPARTWTAAKSVQQTALFAFAVTCMLLCPDMFGVLRRKITV